MSGILAQGAVNKTATASTNVTVAMSPGGATTSKANGTVYSANFNAVVSGGVGPFTYAWALSGNDGTFSLSGATTATATVSGTSGSNQEHTVTLTVTVTDTGAAGKTASDSGLIDVAWGTTV